MTQERYTELTSKASLTPQEAAELILAASKAMFKYTPDQIREKATQEH